MPSDIRSFFGGKGGHALGSSQEQKTLQEAPKEKRPQGRRKRKVLSDSEDDVKAQPSKKSTPKKPPPKKHEKRESPVGELTTTSDYFASSGKSKPSRSTPTKPKAQPEKNPVEEPKRASTQSASKAKSTPKSESVTSVKPSSRKKRKPSHVEVHEDENSDFEPKVIKDDADSGEDIFVTDYKTGRKNDADAYESDDDEDEVLKPTRKVAKRGKGAIPRKQAESSDDDIDVQIKDVSMKDIPEYREPKAAKITDTTGASKGRKRKSAELDGEDDEDVAGVQSSKKGKSSKPKSTPKKKQKEDELHVRTAVDDILDSIPTVRPPTPPPREDGKKFNYQAFAANRSEAAPSGSSIALPTGAENCLASLTFVFTGVLETLERSAGQDLVKRHGGKITTAPSKKTSFVVLGNDAGPKKLETIEQFGLKTINEVGLFELIRRLPANGGDGKAGEQYEAKRKAEEAKAEKAAEDMIEKERLEAKKAASTSTGVQPAPKGDIPGSTTNDSRLWTVKYAPTATSMIVGNKGQVEKLQAWLRAWPINVRIKFKKPGKEGWGAFRAMCLHGPPGIGKTTAAHLAANLEGYDILESNASDTRSKKLVETGLRGVLDTTSLLGYFAGDGKKVEAQKKKLVLIMDEVDGMSAGDRGGVGALAAVCRKTSVPIILICNDRKQPKMKPFDSVAFDLPFRRPTTDQIRQRIMTICFREKLKIPPPVINALIEGTHADIRQVINMLSTAKLDQDAMDFDAGKQMSKSWEKHVILKPWDIVSKILGGGMFASNSTSTLNDKIELYFNDHEFSSLMLQENYLGTNPILSNSLTGKEKNLKMLELVDNAAESISDGDLVDRMIHGSQQQWALMPTHAVYSFVRPASFVYGSQAGSQTRFTSWLGNNSKTSKLMRFIKEIQGHMRLRASGDRHEIRQQYLPMLWYRLVKELQVEGKESINKIIELMDSYYLTKDDWDAVLELGVGSMDMEGIKIDSQAKSSFTRIYNQISHPLPYMKASQVVAPKKKEKDRPDIEDAMDESDSGASEGDDQAVIDDEEPLDLKKDKYVKAGKKKVKSKKGGAKGKGKIKDEDEDDLDEESEEDIKPKKGAKGKGKAKK
ncbi:replication factor C subunit 1, partial [Lecanoromycetidae sp. Uapishka_2]